MWSELAVFWYILKYGTSDRWGSGEGERGRPQSGGGGRGARLWDTGDGLGAACRSSSSRRGGRGRLACLQRGGSAMPADLIFGVCGGGGGKQRAVPGKFYRSAYLTKTQFQKIFGFRLLYF